MSHSVQYFQPLSALIHLTWYVVRTTYVRQSSDDLDLGSTKDEKIFAHHRTQKIQRSSFAQSITAMKMRRHPRLSLARSLTRSLVLLALSTLPLYSCLSLDPSQPRRHWLQSTCVTVTSAFLPSRAAAEVAPPDTSFSSARSEYTNSIVASRDTNISPQEVYDTIASLIPPASTLSLTALDMGAGAGVSTSVLYRLGYRHVTAVDWSRDAWDAWVLSGSTDASSNSNRVPDTVQFIQATDDDYFAKYCPPGQTFDVIVYNFAINPTKAIYVATHYLNKTTKTTNNNALLLAPVNESPDYWYKQRYWLLNAQGDILYQSGADVGAWSVQFQPDVTSSTCTGVWCGSALPTSTVPVWKLKQTQSQRQAQQ
jgi:SAM-dependent methyltransferase